MIAVTTESLLVQAHYLAAVRAFANARRAATGYLPATFPRKTRRPILPAGQTPGVA
jgi:hypothetical protein